MRTRRLSSQILAFQALTLVGVFVIGLLCVVHFGQDRLDSEAESRALAVAHSVAAIPTIATDVADNDRSGAVDRQANAINRASGSSFVVVTNRQGIRFSHPNPKLVYKEVSTSPDAALHGHTVLAVQMGTLGRSARAKVPLRLANGTIVGEVSVGVLETTLQTALRRLLPTILEYGGALLALALLGSLLFAARLRRQTFGVELSTITDMFREREAVLRGIREGVVAVDQNLQIRLVTDSARHLLGISCDAVGQPVDSLEDPQVVALLEGTEVAEDAVLVHDGRVLVANRRPVCLHGREIGAVVTVRDRTELDRLSRQLSGVMTVTDALRAQSHEFSNRMQVIGGLLRLGDHEEAMEYVAGIQESDEFSRHSVASGIRQPLVRALLGAKAAYAAEHEVEFHVDADSSLPETVDAPGALLSILGNLIDNAIDAATSGDDPVPWVEVRLTAARGAIHLRVSDSGLGIAPEDRDRVFQFGHTTKSASRGKSRGVGLALVERLAQEQGGTVSIDDHAAGGAMFEVVLPMSEQTAVEGVTA